MQHAAGTAYAGAKGGFLAGLGKRVRVHHEHQLVVLDVKLEGFALQVPQLRAQGWVRVRQHEANVQLEKPPHAFQQRLVVGTGGVTRKTL